MNDQIGFRESSDEWCQKNYPKPTKEILSILGNIFELLHTELKINTQEPDINDIQNMVNTDKLLVEKAFHDIFIKLRKDKSTSTINIIVCVARKALLIMGMNKDRLKIPAKEKEKKDEYLPLELRKLPEDSSIRVFVNERLENSKKNFNLKSDMTKKTMLRYWVKILSCFGSFEKFNVDNIDFSLENVVKKVKSVIISNYYVIYLHHLFYGINDEWNIKLKELKKNFDNTGEIKEEKDGDKDFLTPVQQENILKACENSLEKLVILLLFTTGMRVGGLANIKRDDVYDKETKKIKEYGVTLEKRSKTRRFPIFDITKKPLKEWLDETHMSNNIYIFPSSNDNTKPKSTMYFQNLFKEIAKRAGYEGEEIHIHSCRHSVARNLLEAGNKMEDIGKFLGHTNPTTTAKFYANLSVKETVDRMNTECIGGNKKVHEAQIPNFGNQEKEAKGKRKNKLSKLKNIQIGETSINEDNALKLLEKIKAQKKNIL